jgi:kynureninase
MSGTPSIPSLYTASAGLNVIKRIGISQIREKSRSQTQRIIDKSRERGFTVFSPESEKNRGGAVSLVLPHGYQIKQALEQRQIFVDYRQGQGREPDIIRVGPHFYTKDEEIDVLFTAIDEIFRSGEHKKFPEELKTVT